MSDQLNGKVLKRLPLENGSELVLIDRLGSPADMPLDDINRNVYCLDPLGRIRWRIAAPLGISERTPYTNIYEKTKGTLNAYCWDGIEYAIDLATGNVAAGDLLR